MNKIFKLKGKRHYYQTRNSSHRLTLPNVNTSTYGLNSIEYKCISTWNHMILKFDDEKLNRLKKSDIINYLKNRCRFS